MDILLNDILSFFTGDEMIPPLGFEEATLSFNEDNPYPTASTCGLALPSKYQKYDDKEDLFLPYAIMVGLACTKSVTYSHVYINVLIYFIEIVMYSVYLSTQHARPVPTPRVCIKILLLSSFNTRMMTDCTDSLND